MLGVAGYFGVRTLWFVSRAAAHCDADYHCNAEGMKDMYQAGDAQAMGSILAGIGAAALGAGVALFVTARAPAAGEVEAFIAPTSLGARGTW